jgi:MinD-like ATPase involved in chromosome partitioning or flagellar assembly
MDHLTQEAGNLAKLKKVESVITVNPMINSLKTEIESLSRAIVAASVDYTQEHPEYIAVEKKLKNAKESLKKEAEKAFSQETNKQSGIYDTVASKILDLVLDHITYEQSIASYQALLDKCYSRQNEIILAQSAIENAASKKKNLFTELAEVEQSIHTLNSIMTGVIPIFRILSPSTTNMDNIAYYKYFPKRKTLTIWSAIIAFCLLSFLVVAKEIQSNTLYNGWQLSSLTKDIIYTDIPVLEDVHRQSGMREQLTCCHMHGICLSAKDSRIVRIASWQSLEGKATVGTALAWYYKRLGYSVIIVDGDIQNRSLSRAFGHDKHPGLMDYMCQKASGEEVTAEGSAFCQQLPHSDMATHALEPVESATGRDVAADAAQTYDLSSLPFIPAGSSANAGSNGYRLTHLTRLFEDLMSRYDRVVFVDSPITENYFLLADSLPPHDVILVMESGKHSIYDAENVAHVSRSTAANSTLRGIIVNKAPVALNVFTYKGLLETGAYILLKPVQILKRVFQR